MPTAIIDGIATRYEVIGAGPPLLMYSPGGFDATVEKWSTQGIYPSLKLLDHLPCRDITPASFSTGASAANRAARSSA